MTVGIVGLGLIGGSFAKAYHAAGWIVYGYDTDASMLAFAQLADASTADAVTPEMVARVLEAEGLHDMVLINKVESDNDRRAAERIAALCTTPVVAGSLWRKEFRCLR